MLIDTKEKYEEIPNGTILEVFLTGDDWEEDTGKIEHCIKRGEELIPIKSGFFLFGEKDCKDEYEDLSFIVCKKLKRM